PPLRAFGGHLLPVGLLPVLDIIALQTAFLIGGAVVTETLFARQGVGRVLLDAVLNKDLPVIQAAVIVTAGAVVGLNALADVLRTLLDPRVRQS
ncbi:MAG: ABC transporter permease subunit, partial [Chloroflexi bacterium]|nr:ABC transporter permease subunit [Chloroflexota bacterium]